MTGGDIVLSLSVTMREETVPDSGWSVRSGSKPDRLQRGRRGKWPEQRQTRRCTYSWPPLEGNACVQLGQDGPLEA